MTVTRRRPEVLRKPRISGTDRRAQLLALAKDIINDQGIGALTMSALAEAANAAKPIVYYHFTNSEDVAVALLNEHFAKMADYVLSRLGDPDDIKAFLRALIDALFEFHAIERLSVRNITSGFSSTSKVDEAYLAHQGRTQSAFRDLLQRQGLSGPTLDVASYGLMTFIRETVFEFAERNDPGDGETIKRMADGIVDGLLGTGAARSQSA